MLLFAAMKIELFEKLSHIRMNQSRLAATSAKNITDDGYVGRWQISKDEGQT